MRIGYAEGAKVGAPEATQVVDRFHLVQNASNALVSMLRSRALHVEENEGQAPIVCQLAADGNAQAPERPLSPTRQYQAQRRAARIVRWEKVKGLALAKASISEIARQVGITHKTVRRLISLPEPPRNRDGPRKPAGLQSAILQPHASYLQRSWEEGCQNVSLLFREIKGQGYPGSLSRLRQALYAWQPPRTSKKERERTQRLSRQPTLRWLCLRPQEGLKPEEKEALGRLLEEHPELALGHKLLRRFRQIVSERDLPGLDVWLEDARKSCLPTFVALASGIEADRKAVENALRLLWSNGPVEGLITKVKLIKRQGYGRASFDLLRTRVLAA